MRAIKNAMTVAWEMAAWQMARAAAWFYKKLDDVEPRDKTYD